MKILVPVDYSDHARVVVGKALELARALGGRVRILHVWETKPNIATTVKVVTPEGRNAVVADLIREDAESRMAEFVAKLALPADIPVKTRILSGGSGDAILAEAERGKYDLIVMGTKGRSGLGRFVLGSVAEKVLRTAKVPVLAVPLVEAD